MFIHAMLKHNGIRALNTLQTAQQNHARIFPLALGYVLSTRTATPSMELEDPRGYFRLQCQVSVEDLISKVNELLPHDAKQTMEDTKAFFFYRIAAANPAKVPLAFNKETALVSFFGIGSFFSSDALNCIVEQSAELTNLIANLTALVSDLTTEETRVDTPQEGLLNTVA